MRSALVAEIVAALNALDTEEAPFPAVTEHTGDDEVFNEEAAFPWVSVGYADATFGPGEEHGATTYLATFGFEVAIATRDTAPKTRDGQAAALALADRIEEALNGLALSAAGGSLIFITRENLVEAWAGRFLYVQTYQVEALVSRGA